MNIIEIIKRNIGKNQKIKLLDTPINKSKVIDLFSKMQDTIGISDLNQNIEYINRGEAKNLKELFNYQGNEITYNDMIKTCMESGSYSGDTTLYMDGMKTTQNIFLYRMQDNILFFVKNLEKYIQKNDKLEKELKMKV